MPSSHRLTQQTIQKRGASVPKVDFQEMLYLLFKQLLGSTNGLPTDVSIGDKDVLQVLLSSLILSRRLRAQTKTLKISKNMISFVRSPISAWRIQLLSLVLTYHSTETLFSKRSKTKSHPWLHHGYTH